MEDSKKRWSVTFTKHIKQKRKVYQDGFLDLHISTNKVKLYDDCEKLLECRILKKEEVVSSGETLSFNAYSVDVGDPEGDFKHAPDLNYQGRYRKKSLPGSLSPSQKIISEFKKRELQKYGIQQSSPETTKPRTTEWEVLYTTQLTQKAKKYHDGFLRLASSGSQRRQIMLFDETRRLLDSRFLRRNEEITTGESITFDGHLVEVGDCEENHDLKVNNWKVAGKSQIKQEQQNFIKISKYDGNEFKKNEVLGCGAAQISPDTAESNITEWQAMYTTQVMQKAKKYHDGFLRLSVTGHLQRQIMLYDEGRKLLYSKFLKKDEIVRSGESIAFDGYLVDVGEPQGNHQFQMDLNIQGNNGNVVPKTEIIHRRLNCLKADKAVVKGKPQNDACSRENADSTSSISRPDGINLNKSVSTNKPLRDATQILSILQRPVPLSVECPRNGTMGQLSSTKRLEVSDAVVGVQGTSKSPEPRNESCDNMDMSVRNGDADIGNFPVSKSKSTSSGSQISNDTQIGNFNQPHLDLKGCNNGNDEAFVLGISSSNICASQSIGDVERKSPEEPKSDSRMDQFPSFDLGF